MTRVQPGSGPAIALALVSLALVSLVGACASPPPDSAIFPVELNAATDGRTPVAGVQIWADGVDLGATSSTGDLRAELHGRDGQAVALSAACPPGYRTLDARRRVVLQRLNRPGPSRGGGLGVRFTCQPTERSAIVIVRARASAPLAGMPILKDGTTIGQTDQDGTAHLLLKVRPASALRIALDTSAWPELVPRNPVQSYDTMDEDSLLLIDQRFAIRAPAPAHRLRRPLPPAARGAERAPYRIR